MRSLIVAASSCPPPSVYLFVDPKLVHRQLELIPKSEGTLSPLKP